MNVNTHHSFDEARQSFYAISQHPLKALQFKKALSNVFGTQEDWVEVVHLESQTVDQLFESLVCQVFSEQQRLLALGYLRNKISKLDTTDNAQICLKINAFFKKVAFSSLKSQEKKGEALANKNVLAEMQLMQQDFKASMHLMQAEFEQDTHGKMNFMQGLTSIAPECTELNVGSQLLELQIDQVVTDTELIVDDDPQHTPPLSFPNEINLNTQLGQVERGDPLDRRRDALGLNPSEARLNIPQDIEDKKVDTDAFPSNADKQSNRSFFAQLIFIISQWLSKFWNRLINN